MELADLPPELYETIIGHYVSSVGISTAWRQRQVCKSFAAYIKLEILANQPAVAFRPRDRRLVHYITPALLERRIINPKGISKLLPQLIEKIVTTLVNVTNKRTPEQRKTFIKLVSRMIGLMAKSPFNCIFRATRAMELAHSRATGQEEALIVAIGLRDTGLIDRLLRTGITVWGNTTTFGNTLDIASIHGGHTIVRHLAVNVRSPVNENAKAVQKRLLTGRIVNAIKFREEDAGIEFLYWYLTKMSRPTETSISAWMNVAVDGNTIQFLDYLLLNSNTPETKLHIRQAFLGRSHYPANTPEVLRLLLHHRIFSTDNIDDPPPTHHKLSLLHIAVSTEDVETVRLVLDAGADANGILTPIIPKYGPLWTAIEHKDCKVAQLLIRRGEDPQLGMNRTIAMMKIEDRVGDWQSEICKVIDRAIKIKNGQLPEDLEMSGGMLGDELVP